MNQQVNTEQKEPIWLPAIEKLAEFTYLEIAFLLALLIASIWRKFIFFPLFQQKFQLLYSIEENKEIDGILYRILELAEADRVILFQFHNGGIFASGKHFVYLSATHEVTKSGIVHLSRQLHRVPLSRISEDLDRIKDGKLHFIVAKGQKMRCQVYLASIGVEAFYTQMLFLDKEPLAIINIEYIINLGRKVDEEKLKKLLYQLTSILAHPTFLKRFL